MAIDIYPSILEKTVESFVYQINNLLPLFNHFQIDFADGVFVDNRTVQLDEIIEHMAKNPLSAEDKTFEVHLMVENYETELEKIDQLKKYVNITCVLVSFQPLTRHNYIIPNTTYPVGLVLNPEDNVNTSWKTLKIFDTLQLMTIVPGRQGNLFVPEVLDKIAELRELGYDGKIILDGAMDDKTLPIILTKKYLQDAICPGSFFHNENPQASLNALQTILEEKVA